MDIRRKVRLDAFTTIGIGGIAEYFAVPRDQEELADLIKLAQDKGKPIHILGRGANTIFGDFEGFVVYTKNFSNMSVEDEGDKGLRVKVAAGVDLHKLVKLAVDENLEGVYRLVGLPATVGGAVSMNAGAFGYEISEHLLSVKFLGWDGNVYTAMKQDLNFSYRNSPFPSLGVVLECEFLFQRTNRPIFEEFQSIKRLRKEKQPINMPTSGSTFKNPQGHAAGKLLEEVGMKGFRIGGVAFSEVHANFLINVDRGTFQDVLKIIQVAKRRVLETFGIELEEEVVLVGKRDAFARLD